MFKANYLRLAVLSLLVIALLAMAAPAFADGPGNSTPGIDRYIEIAANANPDAQCGSGAASGAFGYLGKGINPGQESWDGGNGTKPGTTHQTGVNNSAVCGNN